MNDKEALRDEVSHALRAMSSQEYKRRSSLLEAQLIQHLATLEIQSPFTVVGTFLPLRGEPRWEKERWSSFPWKLAYPSPDGEGMVYRLPEGPLPQRGHWVEKGEECRPEVIVVPGLVFSNTGYRIGRGGGFYDRLLANWSPAVASIGVCFEEQLRNGWEPEAHDRKLDLIITDKRIIHCGPLAVRKEEL